MKLGIMQPYFFPYLGYFQNIAATDVYVICDHVAYAKQGWVDRNQIAANTKKESVYFRPQVEKPVKSGFLIEEVMISSDDFWRRKLLKSLWHTYNKASYVDEIYPFLERLINYKPKTLSAFNFYAIQSICQLLRIETRLLFNAPELKQVEEELPEIVERYQAHDPFVDRRQVRVIEFCKRKQADHFINTIAGAHLYTKETFNRYGLELSFVKSKTITYTQFPNRDFVPHLSIIDVLMHAGVEKTKQLVTEYLLI
ncbi:WbqC family protein [Flagellimonas marinaquae]